MSATRLLLLGVVRWCGKAHGYLVRAELESWWAHDWANIKWGSIYHGLKQLSKEGLLTATTVQGWPERVDYALTEQGEEEFLKLLRTSIREHDEYHPDVLGAALVLMSALPRAEVIDLFSERLAALTSATAALVDNTREVNDPPHVRELFGLWTQQADTYAVWLQRLLDQLQRGAYVFAGEAPQYFAMPGGAGHHDQNGNLRKVRLKK